MGLFMKTVEAHHALAQDFYLLFEIEVRNRSSHQ